MNDLIPRQSWKTATRMANNGKSKLKLLYIRQILEDETDEEHGITMSQLISRLEEHGIPAERKGVYRDIQTLREFGMDIQTYQRNPVEYAIARRDFTLSELMLLVDAVESCKSLTRQQANALTRNLKLLASDGQRALLERRIHVPDRIRPKNESAFSAIDVLHDAIRQRRKVRFGYFKRGSGGKRRMTHGALPYTITPLRITYADGFYYLTAWNEEAEDVYEFRVDRMDNMQMINEKATRINAASSRSSHLDDHVRFGRFGGEPMTVTLDVDEEMIEVIMDRFGDAAHISPKTEHEGRAVVKVQKSPQFFGWIAGLNGTVRIAAPKALKAEYLAYLRCLLDG